jgi:hypothetical protein
MKNTTQECSRIQQLLCTGQSEHPDSKIMMHLASCDECRRYAEMLNLLAEQYAIENMENRIEPDPEILNNLRAEMIQKQDQQTKIKFKIRRIIEYRVPVYQIAAAAAVIFFLFFAVDKIPEPDQDIYPASQEKFLSETTELAQINLMDSLMLSSLKNVGRNALEDSAITKYLVGAL